MYFFKNKSTPWDLTDLLWSGFAIWDDLEQEFFIERAGPFVPDIYEADGVLIFTNAAKLLYEQSALTGIEFTGPLKKRKIVNIDWQTWDLSKDWTDYIEADNIYEPDEIIGVKPHDPLLAQQIPELWQAKIETVIKVNIDHNNFIPGKHDDISIPQQNLPAVDFFIGDEFRTFIFTEKAKPWLESNFAEFIDFYAIRLE